MYQFIFTTDEEIPFTLYSMVPKKEIPLNSEDKLSEISIKGTTIVVEKSDMDCDSFLDLLVDEVTNQSMNLCIVNYHICLCREVPIGIPHLSLPVRCVN